jgi:hypothetical protein
MYCLTRVEWLVSEHLSAQDRPDPRGGLSCCWCPRNFLIPPIGAFDALKIIKNRFKLRKLWPHKVEGSRTQKKNHRTLQSWFLNMQKIPCMLLYCY